MPDLSFRVEMAGDDGGEVRLVVTSATVLRIFAITGFDQVISSFSHLDLALAAP
jgi:anti-anti-sigma regulatory factor